MPLTEAEVSLQERILGYRQFSEVFEGTFALYSAHPAISYGSVTLDYKGFEQAVNALAVFLQNCTELQPGDRLAICLPDQLQYPVTALAALKVGLVLVNINSTAQPEDQAFVLRETGAKGLVVSSEYGSALIERLSETPVRVMITTNEADLQSIINRTWLLARQLVKYSRTKRVLPIVHQHSHFSEALTQGRHRHLSPVTRLPEDLAMIQYTSGTSGRSRAVMLTQRNMIANTLQAEAVLGPYLRGGQECLIATVPLHHSYGFLFQFILMCRLGNHLILRPPVHHDGFQLVKLFQQWKPTLFFGMNSLFVTLLGSSDFSKLDFTSLKFSMSGGEALTHSTRQQWEMMTQVPLYEGYGLTECSPVVSLSSPISHQEGSSGKPLPLTRLQIVDEEGIKLQPGERGELIVSGPQVMSGYWKDAKTTIQALPDGIWLSTGDIARVDDKGYLEILDRKSDLIHVGGFVVYPTELENIISGHADIIECAVVGIPHPEHGEIIKLYVVSQSARLTVKTIREYCRQRLTSYKVPKLVEFCRSLPKNDSGKVVRRVLREESVRKIQRSRLHW